MRTKDFDVDIQMDYVSILGVKVPRPKGMARGEWMTYWEARFRDRA